MGYWGRPSSVLLAFWFVTLAMIATACTDSGDDEPTEITSQPPVREPAITADDPPAPVPPAVPALVVADLEWESLNGPPGGNIGLVTQDTYRLGHIYAAAARGIYRTTDQGDSWQLVGEGVVRDVSSIGFGPHGVYMCTPAGLLLVLADDSASLVGDPCLTVVADDSHIYTTESSEGLGEPRVELWRATVGAEQPTRDSLVWDDVTPPYATLATRPDATGLVMSIDDLIAIGDSLVASVALGGGPLAVNSAASETYVSTDSGDTWQHAEIGIPEPLVVQKLRYDSASGLLFALAHVHITDGPWFPLADLVRVSRDRGQAWEPLTEQRDVASATVGDVAVLEDRFILTNVDHSITELDKANPNEVLRRYRPEVEGYTPGYVIEELIYDLGTPGAVYSQAYFGHEGVARSLDYGQTWEATVNGIVSAPTGNINVHPTVPNTMVASGNLGYAPQLTTDGGETWRGLTGTASMADELAFDPHDPEHILFMTEGSAFFESFDGGATWTMAGDGFSANRVHSLSLSADQDVLYSANLGTNVSSITGLLPDDDVPIGFGENAWSNMNYSPDYAYAIAAAPDGSVFASYSPKKFEDHAAVWRYRGPPEGDPAGWTEVLRIPGATGVTDIAIGPGSPYTVYAGGTGETPGVWVSRDGGDNWESVHHDGFRFVTVHAVAIDPYDPDVIYAAPWGDGLYRSVDRGGTWDQLDVPTVSVAAIVIDPLENHHIIVGDRTRPVIWETWDSGVSWNRMFEFDDAAHYRVMALARTDEGIYVSLLDRVANGVAIFAGVPESGSTFRIGPDGPHLIEGLTRSVLSFAYQEDTIFAVTHLSGVYEIFGDQASEISGDLPDMGFNHVVASEGGVIVSGGSDIDAEFRTRVGDPSVVHNIYRWAEDGAWQPLLDGDPFGSPIKQLARHRDTGALVAATGTGVYVSTDEGFRWMAQSDGLDFVNIGSIAMVDDTVVVGTLGAGVAVGRIDVSGHIDWSAGVGPQSDIANIRIAAAPTDPGRLWASSYPGGVFRSHDGGATWTESNFGIPSFDVADPLLQGYYSLVIDPADANQLLLSIFEHGVFESGNGGATWRPIGNYGANAEIMQAGLTAIAIDGGNNDRLWLATSDRGVLTSPDRGTTWESWNEGMTTREVLTLETSSSGAVFAGTAGYGVFMLEPGATTWEHMGRAIGAGQWSAWDRRLYQYGSFLFDPVHEQRVYLGHFPGGFFVSDDGGHSWESGNIGLGNDGMFSLVAHPEEPDVLFAGTYNGIVRSDDAGRSWRDVSEGMPPEQWPFSVIIDDLNPNVMYTATKNGHNKGFCDRNIDTFCGIVMRSDDGGETWTTIADGLPSLAEFYMVVLDPRDHEVLYVSSSRGVFVSADRGGSWSLMNGGLPDIEEFFVRDNVAHNMELTPDGRSLVLTIVGYGVWQADLPELSQP